MELNNLNEKLSEKDYQYFVSKKVINHSSYGMTYEVFYRIVFSKCVQAKKNVLPLHTIFSQTSYANLIPFFIHELVTEFNFTDKDSRTKIDLNENIHSKLAFLFYCQELSQKKEFNHFNPQCSPHWFSQKFEKHFHIDLIPSYFSLLKSDLIESLPHLYDILHKKNENGLKINKDNANVLIDIFCYYQDERCIEELEKMVYLLRSSDPSMTGIKTSKLLKEIEKTHYDDSLRQRIFTMLSVGEDENDFIYLHDKKFTIELDIEKLISFRKKNNIDEHIQHTIVWFLQLNLALLQAKSEHILFCDAYQDKTELMKKIQRHNENSLYQRAAIEIIKDFEFSYIDNHDKEIKQDIFNRYFKEAIYFKYDIPLDNHIAFLKKLTFNFSLDNSLDHQSSSTKTRKI